MKRQLTKYLYQFKDREYYEINGFLKENFGKYPLQDLRGELFKMKENKVIEVSDELIIRKLGQHIIIPEIHPTNNVLADLDTWPIKARLSIEEKDRLDEEVEKSIMQPASGMRITDSIVNIGSEHYKSPQSTGKSSQKTTVKTAAKTPIITKIIIGIIVGVAVILIGRFVFHIG